MDLVLPSFAFRRSDFTEVDLEATQEIPWPGTLRARTEAAAAVAASRLADAAARRRNVAVAVARDYYRLRYVVSARETIGRQRGLLATAVEIATARYATGQVPQSDPLQARLTLARLDADEAGLEAEDGALRASLGALRGVSGAELLRVDPIEPLLHQLEERHQQIAPLEAATIADHPSLAARRSDLAAAGATARAEALAGRPDFAITARYGARPIASDFFSAFLGLRIPLWAGRKQHRLAEAAREDASAATAGLDAVARTLDAEWRTISSGIAAGQRRIDVLATRVIPAARETAEATLRGYRVGQVDFLDFLAAQDSRYRTEIELAMAIADHLAHLIMLEQLLRPEDS
jgi:outer membrane protein TolC